MLQTISSFCSLTFIGRPTFVILNSTKECNSYLAIKKKINVSFSLFFYFSIVLIVGYIAYCLLYPPFTFCSSVFYLRDFTSTVPCHVAAAFDLWKHKRKPSHMSDCREDVNILLTERKRKVNTDYLKWKQNICNIKKCEFNKEEIVRSWTELGRVFKYTYC